MEELKDLKQQNKRGRDDSELVSEIDSPEVKRLREDLLDCFDDDAAAEFGGVIPDLDSFMKSFEEEIAGDVADPVANSVLDCGESRPDLGYLLEASDDELGLPPTASSSQDDLVRVEADPAEFGGEFWEMANYDDTLEFGYVGVTENSDGVNGGEYVALDGLFNHSDLGFGLEDFN